MGEPCKTFSAVFPIILNTVSDTNGEKTMILLGRRQNTGYQDGKWDIAGGGHVDENETARMAAVRECKEELGIDVNVGDLKFVHLCHRFMAFPFTGRAYYDIYFLVEKYAGTPAIMEPDKCSGLEWFDIGALPEDMVECRKAVVRGYGNESYSEYFENL